MTNYVPMITGTKIAQEKETKSKKKTSSDIAIIILNNITQGTVTIGEESQFYGQFAEQSSFSWNFSGFGVISGS